MYTVEAEVLKVDPSITYPPTECAYAEWIDVCTVPQLETDQAELQEARAVATLARQHYTRVRITEGVGGTARRVVA